MTFASDKFAAATSDDAATPGSVYRAFEHQREELTNLASFLTGSGELADVCLIDAYDLCLENGNSWEGSLDSKVRRATFQSAMDLQAPMLAALRPIYSKRHCPHGQHAPVSPEVLTILTSQVPRALVRLDVMCRFALVLRASQDYSPEESAIVLGVSREVLEAVYCSALRALSEFADELLELRDEGASPEVWD